MKKNNHVRRAVNRLWTRLTIMFLWSNRPKSVQGWSESFRKYAHSIQDHWFAYRVNYKESEKDQRRENEKNVLVFGWGTAGYFWLGVNVKKSELSRVIILGMSDRVF